MFKSENIFCCCDNFKSQEMLRNNKQRCQKMLNNGVKSKEMLNNIGNLFVFARLKIVDNYNGIVECHRFIPYTGMNLFRNSLFPFCPTKRYVICTKALNRPELLYVI